MNNPKIMLVDDDEAFLELFQPIGIARRYEVVPFSSAKCAYDVLLQEAPDLIVSDVEMPDMNGMAFFRKVRELNRDIPFIFLTAFGTTEAAIHAVKEGAFHYFEKPITDKLDLFWTTVREALEKSNMHREITLLRKEKSFHTDFIAKIIGNSEGIRKVIRSIQGVGPLPVTVLISGETGTGKELVARAIHEVSDRKEMPFFAINCNEFAAGVIESELFGHEKGAFTGAIDRKIGLFELVHKGIFFLDEISSAPDFFQSKLLRVLDTKTFMRVGGTTPIYSDFRIIAATNLDLEKEIEKKNFRKDLFYRLNVFPIEIPPLRHRKDDIIPIAEYYLKKISYEYGKNISGMTDNAVFALMDYKWPGNVRELINVIERAVITCGNSMISISHLPFNTDKYEIIEGLTLKDAEKFFIDQAMTRTGNNKTKAAELLGISRKTLNQKIKLYSIEEK